MKSSNEMEKAFKGYWTETPHKLIDRGDFEAGYKAGQKQGEALNIYNVTSRDKKNRAIGFKEGRKKTAEEIFSDFAGRGYVDIVDEIGSAIIMREIDYDNLKKKYLGKEVLK